MEFDWFRGERSFAPEGSSPRLGDPDLTLSFDRPKESLWGENDWFCCEVKCEQDSDAWLTVCFFSDESSEPTMVKYELLPNLWVTWRVRLDELWSKRFFLPVFPGSYKGHIYGWPMSPEKVTRVELRLRPGKDFQRAALYRLYVTDQEPVAPPEKRRLMDEMGQLLTREWSNKTHSVEEMSARLRKEYQEASGQEDERRPGLSRWGGYLNKRFDATGWFRTQKADGRWWLVDPDGYAFFSHGVCYGTRMGEFGWYTGMEDYYTAPPRPDDPEYRDAFTHPGLIAEYVKRHGVTSRSEEWMFNPARANMIRVFGKDWWEAWRRINTRRFRKWGFNTTGIGIVNFIDERAEDYLRLSQMPYVVTLKRFPTTEHFIFRDFPDVFSPEYAENSRVFAENELGPLANDPYLVGYFLHNEPEWLFQGDYCVALELLRKEEPLVTRRHMANWLKERYHTVEALNAAWDTRFAAWEELEQPVSRLMPLSDRAMKDLAEYEQVLILAFGQIPLEACRRVDAHHLCLGLRHGGAFSEKSVDGSAIFDVFSFNCYKPSALPRLEKIRRLDKPTIIGEWHFGGADCGLYRTALLSCVSQEERGKAYRRYLEEAASCPWCVGAHYFEYNDQTVMGRFDGEHMEHGLIDCTNRPYPEMEKAIMATSDVLYEVHAGERPPYQEPFQLLDPHW
ncbi:MAG: beta-galactosidase [Clostridia bacterium]|nr:beta-galactosidase [Clostridia bacterium]